MSIGYRAWRTTGSQQHSLHGVLKNAVRLKSLLKYRKVLELPVHALEFGLSQRTDGSQRQEQA
jgi:hypothetical protein